MQGRMASRGDADYEHARVGPVFNARRPDRYPAAVVAPETEADVVAAVRHAREHGLQVTVRAGGHSWAAWALRDDALLIDLGRLREIDLDPESGIVKVAPAVKGGDELAPVLNAQGRMFPGGHCPSVGLGGFLLQGGQGWNCRRLGWACESVRAIDVVTADGELVHSSEEENPDLLWAARGAGPGFFGVITRFHLQTQPAPRAMTQSNYIYPMAVFDEVMAWAHELLPALDPLVEPVIAATFAPHQAQQFDGVSSQEPLLIVHTTVMADDPEQARALLAPLDSSPVPGALLAEPAAATTLAEEYHAQAEMNPAGRRYLADCMWTDAPAAALARVLAPTFAGLPSRASFAIWYGWAPHRASLPDMAFSMEANVYCAMYTVWDDAAQDAAMGASIEEQMVRWESVSEGVYLGDTDLRRRPDKFLADANFARLEALRAAHDPDATFCSYHLPDGATPNEKSQR